jgi:hypothetical protein
MNMRKAVSVTLGADNLLWLRAQASATARGSLSDVLDRLITDARASGRTEPAAVRSVVGTVDLPDDDEALAGADAYIRSVFERSVRRPLIVKEARRPSTRRPRRG